MSVYEYTQREREIQREKHGSVCRLWISRPILPLLSLCGRQSPCQHSGRHHLSGLALGPRQSPLWSRLDFVVDQWDLRGQTDCHCKLPCMLRKTQFGCTAPHLYVTCLNPDKDRDSRDTAEKQQREGILSPRL